MGYNYKYADKLSKGVINMFTAKKIAIPPIDQHIPVNLQTATFALG